VATNIDTLREQFGWIQVGLLLLLAYFVFRFFRNEDRRSQFREGSFRNPSPSGKTKRDPRRANQYRQQDQIRLLLRGFSFTGQPHEILGVSKSANELEIRRAHRELMKRFHPDKMGPPDSREWHDAQKIAESLNNARDTMLRELRARSESL
jgi:hypothetical protein